MSTITWNPLADQHFAWVEAMGWHNKSNLESLALIASEIGELAAEVETETTTENAFGEELADIVLRTLDLAKTTDVDIDLAVTSCIVPAVPANVYEAICDLLIVFAKWVNTARGAQLPLEFGQHLGLVIRHCEQLAASQGINLQEAVVAKIAKNAARGTRGRLV